MTSVLSRAMMNFNLLFLIIIINSFAFLTIPVNSQAAEKPAAPPKPGADGKPEGGKPEAKPKPEESGKPEAPPKPGEGGKPGEKPKPGETGKTELGVQDIKIGDYPHQVSLRIKKSKQHICGGSILNDSFIITAAHCLYNNSKVEFKPADLVIVAGQADVKGAGESRDIKTILKHPRFAIVNHVNDVALLQLTQKLPKKPEISPILLNEKEVVVGTKCLVTGWGIIAYSDAAEKEARKSTQTLKKEQFTTMNKATCAKEFAKSSYKSFITDNTFCTTTPPEPAKKEKSCQVVDDSGGPLVCNGRLTGIVSYAKSCIEPKHPAIFADVFKHLSWIKFQRLTPTTAAKQPAFRRDPSKKSSSPSKHFCNKYLYLLIIVIAFKF